LSVKFSVNYKRFCLLTSVNSLLFDLTAYQILLHCNSVEHCKYLCLIDRVIAILRPRMYINILRDTVLATDVNKYSLASARCQPIWQIKLANWIYY